MPSSTPPTSPGYFVIRLVPTAAVDGPTFATYLDGLQLQIFQADTPAGEPQPLTDIVYYSPLVVYQFPEFGTSVPPYTTVSLPTTAATQYDKATKKYGKTLAFNSTDGISVGSYLFSADPNSPFAPTNPPTAPLQVVDVQETLVTFQAELPNYARKGTIASFINTSNDSNPWIPSNPAPSFSLTPTGPATPEDPATATSSNPLLVIPFASTAGVTVGMAVSASDNSVPAGTTVSEVDSTKSTVTLSTPLSSQLATGASITFTLSPPFVSFSLTPKSAATVSQLVFASTTGVTVGMTVTSSDSSVAAGTTVAAVNNKTGTVTLSSALSQPTSGSTTITFNTVPASTPIQLTPSSSNNISQLTFGAPASPNGASGVACGMTVTSSQAGLIPNGTTVIEANQTTVTLSQLFNGSWTSPNAVMFTFPLSSGIVQHIEEITWYSWNFFSSSSYVIAPMAVATAVIPLNPSAATLINDNDFINVSVIAKRNSQNIPIDQIFYNVLVNTDNLPAVQAFQLIPTADTAFYISLPPVPGTTVPISLTAPSDGSAPPFDDLYSAIQSAMASDPIIGPTLPASPSDATIATLISSLAPDQCTRLAYEIVWSNQNAAADAPRSIGVSL